MNKAIIDILAILREMEGLTINLIAVSCDRCGKVHDLHEICDKEDDLR